MASAISGTAACGIGAEAPLEQLVDLVERQRESSTTCSKNEFPAVRAEHGHAPSPPTTRRLPQQVPQPPEKLMPAGGIDPVEDYYGRLWRGHREGSCQVRRAV